MLESNFQKKVKEKFYEHFPNGIMLKMDPSQNQGFPDLLFLVNERWGALEVKRSEKASRRPNQEFWVETLNDISYASFIYPENMEEVFDELDREFGS